MFDDPVRILKIYRETISDGEGLRYSIYLAGCRHHCGGCHNPESWDPAAGKLLTEDYLDRIIQEINSNPLLDGITFSGGDPFYYPSSFLALLKKIKAATRMNIWCYTGYLYEELIAQDAIRPCLDYIDVIVDGRFEEENYSPSLAFRGSTNQRIVKISKSAG
jgi:anaerobic ribonucleoside-triphosphate reductase activating protein